MLGKVLANFYFSGVVRDALKAIRIKMVNIWAKLA
jgi:hypothetical protein